jgi:hypothetical protein
VLLQSGVVEPQGPPPRHPPPPPPPGWRCAARRRRSRRIAPPGAGCGTGGTVSSGFWVLASGLRVL